MKLCQRMGPLSPVTAERLSLMHGLHVRFDEAGLLSSTRLAEMER